MRPFVALLLIVAGLSGCAEEAPEADEAWLFPTALEMNWQVHDCIRHGIESNYPKPLHPIDPPPAWEKPVTFGQAPYGWILIECQSVIWGPYVRGPLTWAAELHGNLSSPDGCEGPAFSVTVGILNLFFDDPEIATYAADRFDLPAHHADITRSRTPTPIGTTEDWTVETDTGTSRFQIETRDDAASTPITGLNRFVWFDDDKARAFDWTYSLNGGNAERLLPGRGQLGPPSTGHEAGVTEMPGAIGQWHDSYEHSADIQLYTDLECSDTEELEPREYEGWSGNRTADQNETA